ncbi:hypothetical protein [Microbacterium proteolyticum]|uniref:hypothetical protein n=1 Tax=Microbacterium proteolyticum TaxID=1572644 RepID=UPI001FADBEDF|nr:hypothetical protein [Microbacterium proteolyticum]MCI9857221.1 hypothetical protein [Microbacterium proteolyticum]
MNEHERTPETTNKATVTDHRRLEVAARRFTDRIEAGLAEAHGERREIDEPTARMIAHVLGRAFGPASAVATFGREGGSTDETLQNEYLALYNDPRTPAATKQWIDWLGTYLVSRNHEASGRQLQNEHLPPQLDRVLYRDQVAVGEQSYVVHVPGTTTGEDVRALAEHLRDLDIDKDEALQSYLTLPDVNAIADNLMESFHEMFAGTYPDEEAALRALSPLEDWENDLADWCIDRGVDFESLQWNYEPLMEHLRTIYDVVEKGGQLHAFIT